MVTTLNCGPRPVPRNNRIKPIIYPFVSFVTLLMHNSEIVKNTLPIKGRYLYFPNLLINIPDNDVEAIIPIVKGRICKPESVGE